MHVLHIFVCVYIQTVLHYVTYMSPPTPSGSYTIVFLYECMHAHYSKDSVQWTPLHMAASNRLVTATQPPADRQGG